MNQKEFLDTLPGQQSERIVDAVIYIANRFDIMAMEISILNCWLKSPSFDQSKVHLSKLTTADCLMAKHRDELTNALVHTSQLIKQLQNELDKANVARKASGIDNATQRSERHAEG